MSLLDTRNLIKCLSRLDTALGVSKRLQLMAIEPVSDFKPFSVIIFYPSTNGEVPDKKVLAFQKAISLIWVLSHKRNGQTAIEVLVCDKTNRTLYAMKSPLIFQKGSFYFEFYFS